ncbi:MAG: beta-1,3-glucanase family protein [Bacteroidales bacterium]|nr:beta-1,3-glucanase family protein [Bacteroidales bacterium]
MKRKFTLLASLMACLCAWADIPLKLVNNSEGQFADNEIYVAIIGKVGEGTDVYYDIAATANQGQCVTKNLTPAVNTIRKDGHDWLFADIFTKLSDIKDKTIYLGDTFACRMLISFKSPMFLHVHDAGGYAGHDFGNPTDPNNGLRWENIEFTYQPKTSEIWINTTRVDAFQYPMGLELYATGDVDGSTPYTKRGEFVDYQTVIDKWNSQLGNTIYGNCLDTNMTWDNLGGIIKQPSKVSAVKQSNIFDDYINKVWDYYRYNDANIRMGVLGRWTGRVSGDVFTLTCVEGSYFNVGTVAKIYTKPSTNDAIEGAGAFASGNEQDKAVQAMFCAAFNRAMIRCTTDVQDWNPEGPTAPFSGGSDYPCNEYVKFFHQTDISTSGGRTYAFAYDDTFEQSATCYSVNPERVTVTIGGFKGIDTGDDNEDPEIPASPRPDKEAANVKSIFSDSYTSYTPDVFIASWNQSTQTSVKLCGGNDTWEMKNFNFQGYQFSHSDATYDFSDMQYVHMDIYPLADMTLNFYPISLNPTVDTNSKAITLKANKWTQVDIPLSDFANVDFTKLGQIKYDGGSGQTLYIDNLYFWKEKQNDQDETAPSDVPDPVHDQAIVKSIFSHKYNPAIATNVGSWQQTTNAEITPINGKNVYKLTNFNYLGLEFEQNNGRLDVSDCSHMHVDYWTPDGTALSFTPISPSQEKLWSAPTVNQKQWNSYDVELDNYDNVDLRNLFQVKFDGGTNNTGYLANVYFYTKTPTDIDNVGAISPLRVVYRPLADSAVVTTDGEASLVVYDLSGRVMTVIDINGTVTLDVSGWARGLYIVQATMADGSTPSARFLR